MSFPIKPAGLCLAALVGTFASTAAPAFDLERLSRLLLPVFLVENYSAVCSQRDRRFAFDTRGPFGTVAAYVTHMRAEITAGLPLPVQQIVVQRAAEAARTRALAALAQLHAPNSGTDAGSTDRWCEQAAKAAIARLEDIHDKKHDALDRTIELAKTP